MPKFLNTAVAFANNDYVHVAWNFDGKPLEECGGFALYRVIKPGFPRWLEPGTDPSS